MERKITRDGAKNVVVMAWGQESDAEAPLHLISPADVKAKQIKLDQIQFACERDVTLWLSWEDDGVILPIEGRGLLNYYQFDSLQPSHPAQALKLTAKGEGHFHLGLDFTKQG